MNTFTQILLFKYFTRLPSIENGNASNTIRQIKDVHIYRTNY